ncbi:MAG: YceI family protein [Sphingobacteriaceae bacterium]|nr:MAG: YceI family protein [Sphingobacteriaceae bacterium]
MKNNITNATVTIICLLTLVLNACKKDEAKEQKGTPYQIEQGSKIKWKGTAANGNFNEGTIEVKSTDTDGNDFKLNNKDIVSGQFKIPVSSIINTNLPPEAKPVLEHHLKTADFFYAALHPAVTFKIISGKPISGNAYLIKGEMTLIGNTHPLEFPAEVTINGDNITVKAAFTFDRTIWGMNYHVDESYPDADRILKGIAVEFDIKASVKK